MANKKLLQITDNGPVKVLGTGTNGWTEKWDTQTNEHLKNNWPRWKDFPTAVQVGDLIWVLKDTVYIGGSTFSTYYVARWTLAGIVVRNGGKNVAYPAVTNNVIAGDSSALYQTGQVTSALLPKPTAYLNVTATTTSTSSTEAAQMLSISGYQVQKVFPQFTGSDVTHYFTVGGRTSSSSDYVNGMGKRARTIEGNIKVASIFPPIRYKWQFEELYGKESDWVGSFVGDEIWKDTYPSGTTDKYPYVFEEPSESLFRDVPGDTTGDGVDDSAIAVAALAAAAIALPSLDVSKCKLDINTKALDDSFSSLKDSLLGAVDTSGLSALASKASELKDSLLSNLPELPEFPDFASQFASLDFNNPVDVAALKDKWGNIVSGIDGMLDKAKFDPANLDICSVKDIKAEVQEDGSYTQVVVPPPVEVPREKPKEIEKTTVKVEEAIEKPQSTSETKFGVNPKLAEAGKAQYLFSWKKLGQDSEVLSKFDLIAIEAAFERRIELRRDSDYTEFKRRVSEKLPLKELAKYIDDEAVMARELFHATTQRYMLSKAQQYVSNHILQYAGFYYNAEELPTYPRFLDTLFNESALPRLGQIFLQYDAAYAVYSQSDLDKNLAFASLINSKIEEYVWQKDIVKDFAIRGIVHPRENTNLTQQTPPYVT
jgi:hypothetical protein